MLYLACTHGDTGQLRKYFPPHGIGGPWELLEVSQPHTENCVSFPELSSELPGPPFITGIPATLDWVPPPTPVNCELLGSLLVLPQAALSPPLCCCAEVLTQVL